MVPVCTKMDMEFIPVTRVCAIFPGELCFVTGGSVELRDAGGNVTPAEAIQSFDTLVAGALIAF